MKNMIGSNFLETKLTFLSYNEDDGKGEEGVGDRQAIPLKVYVKLSH